VELFSTEYITEEEALEEFKRILSEKPAWKKLTDSQSIDHISRQVTWPLRAAQWRIERAQQEIHISTAVDRSSVLAGAEDRQYVPRKPAPAYGTVFFYNSSESATVNVQAGTVWYSDDQLPYQLNESVIVAPLETASGDIEQSDTVLIETTISEEKPYYEILLSDSVSSSAASVSVYVDEGLGFQEWTLRPRMLNTNENSLAYDEFYTSLDELGIRFGNGDFGRIPAVNSSVRVVVTVTEGDTELIEGQKLTLFKGSTDPNIGSIEARTSSLITGGREIEGIEEIRRSALYSVLYDDQLVWDNDYEFLIKRRWPEISWLSVWGEQEQEQETGVSLDNINKIFVSAHSSDTPDIQDIIVGELDPPINREYKPVAPNLKPFTVTIAGIVPRTLVASTVQDEITDLLIDSYGIDSLNRKEVFKLKDMYKLMNGTGYFDSDAADLDIAIAGDTTSNGLDDLVYLDIDNSDISITYE